MNQSRLIPKNQRIINHIVQNKSNPLISANRLEKLKVILNFLHIFYTFSQSTLSSRIRIINFIDPASMQEQSSALKSTQRQRKISRLALQRRESLQLSVLACEQRTQLQEYIKNHVQSQRKNILELYSNTIANNEDTNESKSELEGNRISPVKRSEKNPSFQSCKHSQKLMNWKVNHQQTEQKLIHSTKIIIRPKQHKNIFDRFRWKSIEVQRQHETFTTEIIPQIAKVQSPKKGVKAPLPALPLLKTQSNKSKYPKRMSLQNEINPWEYLVLADQPDIYEL